MGQAAVATAKAKTNGSNPEFGDFSIKKISELLKMDRATVSKRLDALKYKPVLETAKLKLYRLDPAMKTALLSGDDRLTDIRVRKETAAAEKLELQNAEAKGELASVAEFTDRIQRVFGSMYKEVVVRMPKRLAARLAKAKTPADVNKILTHDLNGIFKTLRDDHRKFLGNGKK